MVTSLISAYYYLRVVVNMFMREGEPVAQSDFWVDFTWGAAALVTVVVSFVPSWLFIFASTAVLK